MEMPVGNFGPGYDGVDHWQEELERADLPQIRLFTAPNRHSVSPEQDCDGNWVVCNAETAKSFSAAGFFFGRELHQTLGADKKFAPAQARIDGKTLMVWSDEISKPTAVRYA